METSRRYVLMLENDTDDRYISSSTMDELGISVLVKYSHWQEQLPLSLLADPPSLILLSYNTFPDDGLEIIKAFKEHASLVHIPLVVLSEDLQPRLVQQYYAAGVNTVIKKPCSVAETRYKIQTFFNYWFTVAEIADRDC